MKKLLSLSLLFIWLGSLSAQVFNGKLNYQPERLQKVTSSTGNVNILAVMVEFKKYKDAVTSGDGTFGSIYTKAYGDTILDPTPFDQKYFASHLDFAKNYFSKVSNGRLNVTYTILPQVITLSDSMRDYSPPPSNSKNNDQSNLGKFAKEVWERVSAAYPDMDFSKYNLFTVFHAGVGREFATPATLGNERDIPSVYLGLNSLQTIFGSSFDGFSVNNGNYKITNTMILPCTESREVNTVSGTYLYQLTINGLIVSSIASHLGLPDLFNTSTGTTSISRFGLMDGSSIFAYSGLFPPEPSAWEKIYLGWAEPVTLSIGDAKVYLAARRAAAVNDTTILKVPINSTEYYLIENRQRDADKDGLKLTYDLHGQSYSFNLDKDKGRFQWYEVDTVKGVVTDVDDFDWAVPGNGIVIWHIDENIINKTIADDKINADRDKRGIYIEEADGIFDIGEQYTSILGETVYGDGYQTDMWYTGNTSKYFKNIFGPDSKPNTNSNSGANSLITMQNFSAPANKMSFNISFGNSDVKLVSATKLNIKNKISSLMVKSTFYTGDSFYSISDGTLTQFDIKGSILRSIPNFSEKIPAATVYSAISYVIGAIGKTLNIYSFSSEQSNPVVKSFALPAEASSQIVITSTNYDPKPLILLGLKDGEFLTADLVAMMGSAELPSESFQKIVDDPITQIASHTFWDGGYFSFITPNVMYDSGTKSITTFNGHPKKLVITQDNTAGYLKILLTGGNHFYVYKNGICTSDFIINSSRTIDSFSVVDLMNENNNYIIVNNGSSIEAYNLEGKLADNFPFPEPNGYEFVGTPVSIDLDLDTKADIVSCTERGDVYAIDGNTGKVFAGYPLSLGAKVSTVPIFFVYNSSSLQGDHPYINFAAVDSTNRFYSWSITSTSNSIFWSSEFGNPWNNSFIQFSNSSNTVTEFFPTDKAYNYPNPVYNGTTQIRYYVSENADVQIKIFDLGGGLVTDMTDHAAGGFDNETTWDVSKVQSGIYYAHVQVNGESGKSASKIIKIAVIK